MKKEPYHKDFRLGVLGGGQLGRMLIAESIDLDVRIAVLDPADDAPCAKIAHEFTVGDFADYDAVKKFGEKVDVLTIEIEHVNTSALKELEKSGVVVRPGTKVLEVIQDKGLQKSFYAEHGIPTSKFQLIESKEEIRERNRFPVVQKLRKGGYDGRGVVVLNTPEDLAKAFDAPSILEEKVDLAKELSVIVSRHESGEVKAFPCVELEFNPEANLVEMLFAPADITPDQNERAVALATRVIEAFDMVGLLAVELFLTRSGEILVNEVAPRPHNSGHHTIEANAISQYGQLLRAILGYAPGDTSTLRPAAMVNLLGEPGHSGPVHYEGLKEVLELPGVYVHLYGKSETRPFRKMGHVTITADTTEGARKLAERVKNTLKSISL